MIAASGPSVLEQTDAPGSAPTAVTVVNLLLDDLTTSVRERFVRRAEVVPVTFGTILCERDESFKYVYFPLSAFISLVAKVGNHPPLEMGLIGNEGMLGATLILGVATSPLRGVVQGEGEALRLSTRDFQEELRRSPALVKTLNRYLYVLMAQLTQTAGCTRFHEVDARLSRWLLMTHDRAHADHFHLTHQFLADMLGVQRSAVTIAAGILQNQGIIHYTRGEITILDRPGLERTACECYAAVVKDYQQVFGSPRLKPAGEQQDQQDKHDQAQAPARPVAPVAAMRPSRRRADQHQNQNDQQ